jgi:hypothetical protein
MAHSNNNNEFKNVTFPRTRFGESEPARFETPDGIEVLEGPAFAGRAPEHRWVAQRVSGGPCAWGPTREAAVAGVRALD